MDQTQLLIKPVISEKSMSEANRGRFTFAVLKTATKSQIRQAIESQFKVNVISLTTQIVKGKRRKLGKRRIKTVLSSFKKAMAQLKEGQHIDMFEVQKEASQAVK